MPQKSENLHPNWDDIDDECQHIPVNCPWTITSGNELLVSFQGVFTNINSATDFCTLFRMVSRFSVEKFLSYSAEKLRRGTLLCLRKFLVPKNVRDKKGGGYHDFPSKLFCLAVPNHFAEEPLCVSERFGNRKIFSPRGEYHKFLYKICCLTVPKNFVGEPF